MTKQHKYLFGKTGKPLKLTRRSKEKRYFPMTHTSTKDYIERYFQFNIGFVRNDYGY